MGLCKGNRGNLMQHWVLCEYLSLLNVMFKSLTFITTHSMSPWAFPGKIEKTKKCRTIFLSAGERLGRPAACTPYELAWQELSVNQGLPYPSSAVFTSEVWQGILTTKLCEADPRTADEIESWLCFPKQQNRLKHSALLRGDWRASLADPLLLQTDSDCIYFEMDPMRYDIRDQTVRKNLEPATLYPDDVERLIQHLPSGIPIVLQISSFSTQNNFTPIENQKESLVHLLEAAAFSLHGEARVTTQMMTLVFTKNLQLQQTALADRFAEWLNGVE